jgi:cytochrome c peroxidase
VRDVIEYYNRGGNKNPWIDGRVKELKLTKQEVDDLVAFMDALNGDPVMVKEPKLPQ